MSMGSDLLSQKLAALETKYRAQQQEAEEDDSEYQPEPQGKNYIGVLPPDIIPVRHEKMDKYMQAIMNLDLTLPEFDTAEERQYYAELPDMTTLGIPHDDFPDNALEKSAVIALKVMEPDQLMDVGYRTIQNLQTGVSRRDIANLFLLAFNARGEGNYRVYRLFPGECKHPQSLADIAPNDFEDEPIVSLGVMREMRVGPDKMENYTAYCFVAASILSLFTRSPENYGIAWPRIVRGYENFYQQKFPLRDFTPSVDVVRSIHKQFAVDSLFRTGLYRILYVSCGSENNKSMKRFLYEIHLVHTGMHIYPIFVRLCDVLNCKSDHLLRAIKCREYERQIRGIATLLYYTKNRAGGHERGLWRFGRIFDQHFQAVLQTKRCPKLVLILAYALKRERPQEAADIDKIKQLSDVGEVDRKKCKAATAVVIMAIRKVSAERGSGVYTVFGMS